MYSGLEYRGTRLAGLHPHQQVKLAQEADATIFGPVINTNTSKSAPWNLSRTVTFTKACGEVAEVPIHANMGWGLAVSRSMITLPWTLFHDLPRELWRFAIWMGCR